MLHLYPKPLNERIAWQVGYATAQFLLKQAAEEGFIDPMSRTICVGRDMRKSSPSLSAQLKQGMRDAGAGVIDLGLVDTPFVYFAINHLDCAGGVQVTASHNPANYNGFKISKRHAKPVGQATGLGEIQRLAALVESEKTESKGGLEETRDLWSAYREHLLSFIDPRVISGERKLRIAVDASNGMAGTMLPKVFESIGASGVKGLVIEKLYFDNSSGEFVHEPNPLVESNLRELQKVMAAGKFDAGFCFDGDADRCIVLDEKGAPIGCDLLLAWLVQDALAKKPGAAVIYDLRSSRSVAEIVREHGGKPVESRVGHVFMKAMLAESNGVIGGELSGHFYFADMWNTDSGARAFAAVRLRARSSRCRSSSRPASAMCSPARSTLRTRTNSARSPRSRPRTRRRRCTNSTAFRSTPATGGATSACRTPSRCYASISRRATRRPSTQKWRRSRSTSVTGWRIDSAVATVASALKG